MLQELTQDSLQKAHEAFKELYKQGPLAKTALDLATGLTGVNIDAPAKLIVPLISDFRGTIPRRTIPGSSTSWKRITAVARAGTLKSAEGTKSAGWTMATDNPSVSYGSYGLLGDYTWEQDIAGRNLDEDARSRVQTLTLAQFLRQEECCIIGGDTTAYTAGPTPTVVAATSGGSLADATYYVMLVALSPIGVSGASVIARPTRGTNNYDFSDPVPTLSLVDGVGEVSAEGNATVSGGSGAGKITITFTPRNDAVAYAVYIGTTTGAANLKLQGIVTQSTVVVTNVNTTGAVASGVGDDSGRVAPFNGIIQQLVASGSGAYVSRVNGAFSAVVGRGIPEIDAAINNIYDRVREEPDRILCGWTEMEDVDNKLSSVADDRVKMVIALNPNSEPGASLPRFTTYKSPRGKVIKLEQSANLPGGTMLFMKDRLELPMANIPAPWEMRMGSDMVRLDYALIAPKEEFEFRAYGALAGFCPSFQGMLYDIKEA